MVNPRIEGMAHMRVPSSCCKGDDDDDIEYAIEYEGGHGWMRRLMRSESDDDDDVDEYAP